MASAKVILETVELAVVQKPPGLTVPLALKKLQSPNASSFLQYKVFQEQNVTRNIQDWVLLAKNDAMMAMLSSAFKSNRIIRTITTLVHGKVSPLICQRLVDDYNSKYSNQATVISSVDILNTFRSFKTESSWLTLIQIKAALAKVSILKSLLLEEGYAVVGTGANCRTLAQKMGNFNANNGNTGNIRNREQLGGSVSGTFMSCHAIEIELDGHETIRCAINDDVTIKRMITLGTREESLWNKTVALRKEVLNQRSNGLQIYNEAELDQICYELENNVKLLAGMQKFTLHHAENTHVINIDVKNEVFLPKESSLVIVEALAKYINLQTASQNPVNILDVGCGAGHLSIALAKLLSHDGKFSITGMDINPDAIQLAHQNSVKNNVSHLCNFTLQDIFTFSNEEIYSKFDLIMCNPPYLSLKEAEDLNLLKYSPEAAVVGGGDDGLDFYRKLSSHLASSENIPPLKKIKLVIEVPGRTTNIEHLKKIIKIFVEKRHQLETSSFGTDLGVKDNRGLIRCLIFHLNSISKFN